MKIGYIYAGYQKNNSGINKYTKGIMEAVVKKYNQIEPNCFARNNFPDIEMPVIPCTYIKNNVHDESMQQHELYVLAQTEHIDILHSFFNPIYADKRGNFGRILTIYDLSPIINVDWFGGNLVNYDLFDKKIRKSAHEVDHIVTISEATKKDIINYFNVDEEKISIAYPAISDDMLNFGPSSEETKAVMEKFGIQGEYILSTCTLEPRKNLISLIRAYDMYREKHPDSDIKLVLTGALGWNYDNILEQINKSKFSNEIVLTDYVTDHELVILYKNAMTFAYISYFEGFGMPILEGLYYGCAVLASETTSMPEVGGDAVCYCNPYDIESIYASLEKVIEDADYRKQLVSRASAQAAKFSYEKSAEVFWDVYKKVFSMYK